MLVTLAVIVLAVFAVRQSRQLNALQKELVALRRLVALPNTAEQIASSAQAALNSQLEAAPIAETRPKPIESALPMTAASSAKSAVPPVPPKEPVPQTYKPKPHADLETTLGTRWAVWVGGLALALGGGFLVRYSIEAGLFGPGIRVAMAAVFGLALLAAGEFVRRTGLRIPAPGSSGAYIPAILTGAGAFSLFGTIYAAYALYDFIGPGTAFTLLGLVGLATIGLALIHGQAIAGVGLLGALATPVLVSSDAPSAWALFGYLSIVLAGTVAIARIRRWRLLASGAFAGTGLWLLAYMADATPVEIVPSMVMAAVTLVVLALVWSETPERGSTRLRRAFPSLVPAVTLGIAALALMIGYGSDLPSAVPAATVLIAAMFLVSLWKTDTLPLAVGAATATVLAVVRIAFVGTFTLEALGESVRIDGLDLDPAAASLRWNLAGLALLFLVGGLWKARSLVAVRPFAAQVFALLAGFVPLAVLTGVWLALGNPDRDLTHAFAGLLLTIALVAGGELIARREAPRRQGGAAVSTALAFAAAAWMVVLVMAFESGWTTVFDWPFGDCAGVDPAPAHPLLSGSRLAVGCGCDRHSGPCCARPDDRRSGQSVDHADLQLAARRLRVSRHWLLALARGSCPRRPRARARCWCCRPLRRCSVCLPSLC